MKKSTKFLSIIIPTYNRETTIERCLDSVLKQSTSDIEIICVDDASKDKTKDIIKKYENVTLIENESNKGAAYSRNRGLEYATGKYIWFVDSDDFVTDGAISVVHTHLENETVDVLSFDSLRIDNVGERKNTRNIADVGMVCKGRALFVAFTKNRTMRATIWDNIYSRELLEREHVRFTEGYMAEDAFFALKALVLAERAKYIQECLYVYELSPESVTTLTKRLDRFKGVFISYSDMWKLWQNWDGEGDVSECLATIVLKYFRIAKEFFFIEDKGQIEEWIAEQERDIQKLYHLFYEHFFGGYYVEKISEDKLQAIKDAPYVYVYGAGAVAKELIPILDSLEKQVVAYLVSDETIKNQRRTIYGVPIKKMSSVSLKDKNTLIIIATLPKFYDEIEENIYKYGFCNVLRLLD